MKLILEPEQVELLRRIGVAYTAEADYDAESMMALEDAITDYVLMHEIADNDTTDFGEELLALHHYIVQKYDS